MKPIGLFVERISSLRRNLLKTFATEQELQLVHLEIIQYLSICNRYSDTAQALGRYLGQTKGTISQSLEYLEERKLIFKTQNSKDKRVFHLKLTASAKRLCEELDRRLNCEEGLPRENMESLEGLLRQLQVKNDFKGFGICANCKFNKKINNKEFLCELTKETLAVAESEKICNEYSG